MYSCGYLTAEVADESRTRAGDVLFQQFETVAYASTDVLTRFQKPGAKEPQSDVSLKLPIALRLPFVQLIGGLRILGQTAMVDLERNYSGVLVGATGFIPPDGFGMVSSLDCYVALLRPDGQPLAESVFGQAELKSIDGIRVWAWSAPPYEGYPHITNFYASEIDNQYLVISNDLSHFTDTVRKLATVISIKAPKVGNREPFTTDKYWLYRPVQWGETTPNIDATKSPEGRLSALVLKFSADADGMKCRMEVDGSSDLTETVRKGLPGSDVLHYEPTADGVWQASFPLSKDPATTTTLFRVLSLFGFGVNL
jgi:hypothetical protein